MILKPKDVLEKLSHEKKCDKNIAIVFFLNDKKEVLSIHRKLFSKETKLTMSDIFIPAFYLSASFLIIVHVKNQNGGEIEKTILQPTDLEINLTHKIITAGDFLNIKLLDHLIVTKNIYYSFHESGIV